MTWWPRQGATSTNQTDIRCQPISFYFIISVFTSIYACVDSCAFIYVYLFGQWTNSSSIVNIHQSWMRQSIQTNDQLNHAAASPISAKVWTAQSPPSYFPLLSSGFRINRNVFHLMWLHIFWSCSVFGLKVKSTNDLLVEKPPRILWFPRGIPAPICILWQNGSTSVIFCGHSLHDHSWFHSHSHAALQYCHCVPTEPVGWQHSTTQQHREDAIGPCETNYSPYIDCTGTVQSSSLQPYSIII